MAIFFSSHDNDIIHCCKCQRITIFFRGLPSGYMKEEYQWKRKLTEN